MRRERFADVMIGARRCRIVSDDDYLAQIGPEFEPAMVYLFRQLVRPDDIVLDVGANIGCTAILFGDLARAVHAFEPSPSTFKFLLQNVRRSGLRNIATHNIGLGAEGGEFRLTFSPANRSGGFVSDRLNTGAGYVEERIVIRPLDDVVEDLGLDRLDFLKIDVEGFEGSVIRGGRRALAAYAPVVVLELNHWCLNAFQRTSVPDFFDLLRSVFPILHAVDGRGYLDLHDDGDSYTVMYHHILHMRFPNIVAAYDADRLTNFYRPYEHRFEG